MKPPVPFLLCMLAPLIWNGCTLYKPAPVDLRKDSAAWRSVSRSLTPAGKPLTWEQAKQIGLFLNPDLNKARLTYLSSRNAAKYAGLWADPSLSLDGARYVPGVQYDRGVSLGLTLPVTGSTILARKVAELYKKTDLLELRAAENDYLTQLRILYDGIQIVHAKHTLIRQRLRQATDEKERISQLTAAGEASAADLHNATQRYSDLLKEMQELDTSHLSKHLELVNMLGLHPAVGEIEVADSLPRSVPAGVDAPSDDALLQHPRLLAAMSKHKTTEQELRLEIRKQYPNIELSPGYAHEEGDNKVGLGLGFTLPLWNRNREAIARAHGARAVSRHDAVQQWHELIRQVHALKLRQDLVIKHCRTEHERLNALQKIADQQEELYRLGETDLPTLAGARHETFVRRLAYLDCLVELLEIQVTLQSFTTPASSCINA